MAQVQLPAATSQPTAAPQLITIDCEDQRLTVLLSADSEAVGGKQEPVRAANTETVFRREGVGTDRNGLTLRGVVALSRGGESSITYHYEVDRDGDAFVGYEIGDPISTPTPATAPPPTPAPPGYSLANPIPAGESLQGSDGTEVRVLGIVEEARRQVADANTFNDPPSAGSKFYMVSIGVAYLSGTGSINVSAADYSLVGDNRIVYTPYENSCGVIPDELAGELFPGGRIQGNICFEIPKDEGNLVLIHAPGFGAESRRFVRLSRGEATKSMPTAEPTSVPTIADPTTTSTPARTPALDTTPTHPPTPVPTATPAHTPTPVPTATPVPTPTPEPLGYRLGNPVAPGEVLLGSDGTALTITGVTEDAWVLVQQANQFNDPPSAGSKFYIVSIDAAYLSGTGSINVSAADYSLVGDNRIVYTPYENSCGVIPDELAGELFPGGRAQGNVCFEVAVDDGNYVLIHEPFLSFEGERRFLSIDPDHPGSPAELSEVLENSPVHLPSSGAPGTSLGNPIPAGQTLAGTDGTALIITAVTEDAWVLVQQANQFNDPPSAGSKFYIVSIDAAYLSGTGSINVSAADYSLVGDNRIVYTPYENSCGVIPDELAGSFSPEGGHRAMCALR